MPAFLTLELGGVSSKWWQDVTESLSRRGRRESEKEGK